MESLIKAYDSLVFFLLPCLSKVLLDRNLLASRQRAQFDVRSGLARQVHSKIRLSYVTLVAGGPEICHLVTAAMGLRIDMIRLQNYAVSTRCPATVSAGKTITSQYSKAFRT